MPIKIVFMGTPEFSIPTLDALIKNKFDILCVYTQPPKKSKRGQKINPTPIEKFCQINKLEFNNTGNLNSDREYEILKKLSPDLVIVVAYGKLIPKKFLNIAKLGFINIHASLLPSWRGAAPIQRAIMNCDKKIGVSIMKIVEKLDSGPILSTKKINLDENSTYDEIEKTLSVIGAELLIENLINIKNKKIKFSEQNHSKATYAKKISKNETKINWNLDSDKIIAHIHGLSSNPGAWFEFKKNRFKILRVKKSYLVGKPGTVLDDKLTVACKSESIQILEIQREGKKRQLTKDFLLGNKITKGNFLD